MTDQIEKEQIQAGSGSKAGSSTRFLELDALRGLAVLAVILFHYSTKYDQLFGHLQQPYPLDFKYGYFGVHLFFIISGFVIFMTIEKTGTIRMFAFKRFARLYPAYWFSVLLTFMVMTLAALPGRLVSRRVLLVNLTMFQGFLGFRDVDSAYWSLAIELAFYLLIALAACFKWLKHAEIMGSLWLVLAVVLNLSGVTFQNPVIAQFKLFFLDYAAYFVLGMMFFKLHGRDHWRYHLVIGLALGYEVLFQGWLNAGVMFLFICIFHLMIHGKLGFLKHRAILFVGTISYSLYLVHQNLGYVLIRALENLGLPSVWGLLIPITAMILLAAGITFGIEKPAQRASLRMISRLQARRSSLPPGK
jgi:peptidoglycan/LPS O-acetylase OafA/YrhL